MAESAPTFGRRYLTIAEYVTAVGADRESVRQSVLHSGEPRPFIELWDALIALDENATRPPGDPNTWPWRLRWKQATSATLSRYDATEVAPENCFVVSGWCPLSPESAQRLCYTPLTSPWLCPLDSHSHTFWLHSPPIVRPGFGIVPAVSRPAAIELDALYFEAPRAGTANTDRDAAGGQVDSPATEMRADKEANLVRVIAALIEQAEPEVTRDASKKKTGKTINRLAGVVAAQLRAWKLETPKQHRIAAILTQAQAVREEGIRNSEP